jgi:MarR family transcriptional regulator, repressor for mepA
MEIIESTLGLMRWIGFAQMQAANEWSRERGLTPEQGRTLGWLAENPGAMQREIARMSRTSAASVSSLLQGLEKRGLVERRSEEGDDRSKRVYATPEAVALISGFHDRIMAMDDEILAPLSPEERTALHTLLKKVTAELPPIPER